MRNGLRSFRCLAAIVATTVAAAPVWACPLCESSTGQQVRTGIFNDQFASHLLMTLLPFPVLLGILALIHFAPTTWIDRATWWHRQRHGLSPLARPIAEPITAEPKRCVKNQTRGR